MIEALKDEDLIVRMSAAGALGEIKDERAAEPLVALLSDDNYAVRQRTILSLERLGPPGERALTAVLENEDLKTIAAVYRVFINKGIKGSESVLIKALHEYGRYDMAKDFLNCGNSHLRRAAYEWAKARDMQVIPSFSGGSGGPRWGGRR